jgi:hypothetical protein
MQALHRLVDQPGDWLRDNTSSNSRPCQLFENAMQLPFPAYQRSRYCLQLFADELVKADHSCLFPARHRRGIKLE